MSRKSRSGRRVSRGRGGASQATPRQRPHNRHSTPSHTQVQMPQGATTPTFSLAQEARWMSNHRSDAFEPGKQLRNLRIEFVSAGLLQGTISDKEEVNEASAAVSPIMAAMTLNSPSPSPSMASSSSTEDEVVFKGRGTTPFIQTTTTSTSLPIRSQPIASSPNKPSSQTTEPSHIQQLPVSPSPDFSLPPSETKVPVPIPRDTGLPFQVDAPVADMDSNIDSDTGSIIQNNFKRRLGGKTVWESNTPEWVHRSKPGIGWLPDNERPHMDAFLRGEAKPQDAAMDDYMQNVKQFGNEEEVFTTVSRGFSHTELDIDAANHNDWDLELSELQREASGWNADDLHDFDDLSTSSDVMDTIERIVSKRTRKNGLQYLVMYEGSTLDDARWLPASFLKTSTDLELIRMFELETVSDGNRTDSSSEGSNAGDYSSDSGEDSPISDERLARILQKQEELGFSADEVLLHGDDEFFNNPMNVATVLARFDRPNKKRQHRVKGSSRQNQHIFPSASAMADVLDMDPYNGFDIMDTNRPSLRPRKKGRRGQLPPELEDADLDEQLKASWEADRTKKRFKKAEREELRKQGLLGRKGKSPKLSMKYQHGVTIPDVIEDIREFLISNMQTLSLPPMEASRRAIIHQFVRQLDINSKSRGEGNNRFTVLSKTSRTRPFNEDFFDSLMAQNKFNRRLQRGTPRQNGPKTRSAVFYKDGDTVGASAPELGRENKGHALMEKMGWTKGMALGAIDNKGILQPIAHVVKTSKLGLQ